MNFHVKNQDFDPNIAPKNCWKCHFCDQFTREKFKYCAFSPPKIVNFDTKTKLTILRVFSSTWIFEQKLDFWHIVAGKTSILQPYQSLEIHFTIIFCSSLQLLTDNEVLLASQQQQHC